MPNLRQAEMSMPIDRAAIRAQVRKTLRAELAKGDTPGHEFHGNQYEEGGSGSSKDSEHFRQQARGEISPKAPPPSYHTERRSDTKTVGHLKFEKDDKGRYVAQGNLGKWTIEKTGKSYTVHCKGNGKLWRRPDGSHYAQSGLRRETIAHTLKEALETSRRRDDTTGFKGPFNTYAESEATKHARPDHHVDQERSPRGTFGGHRSTAHSDDANSFMGTPNPDSATDMESSYDYHGPAASPEEAIAEDVTFNGDHGGETGELQGDFESGQQGVPQPTLWGLLSLSNRRVVKPVDGEPNIFDDVTRYINTVQGQPDTVLIDPGVTPMEQR